MKQKQNEEIISQDLEDQQSQKYEKSNQSPANFPENISQDLNKRELSDQGIYYCQDEVKQEDKSRISNVEFNSFDKSSISRAQQNQDDFTIKGMSSLLNQNINMQGFEVLINNMQADISEAQAQKDNQIIFTENMKTNEPLQNERNLDFANEIKLKFKIREQQKEKQQIGLKRIDFSELVSNLLEDTQQELKIQKQKEIQIENQTRKKHVLVILKQRKSEQINNDVRHKNKDLYVQLIPIDLMLKDQKSKEPLVFIVVQELWQDLYQKKVEELLQEKMKTFATLSHELRTPLNCSISMLEVLKDELQQEQTNKYCIEEYIVPALFSNKLLLNQINDILDYVQMDCGKFKYSFIDFNLASLLKDCCKLVSIQAKMKNLQLMVVYDQKINQEICSDQNRIRQILLNFLSNALKFTKSGYIELGFNQICQNIYQLYVKDSGIGITKENQRKIFGFCNKVNACIHSFQQLFSIQNQNNFFNKKINYQNKEEEQLNNQGCGLGLIISNSIAKGLVNDEQYNGGISVESEYGQGSKFSILVEDLNYNMQRLNDQQSGQSQTIKSDKKSIESLAHLVKGSQIEQKQNVKNSSFQHEKQNLDQTVNSSFDLNENNQSYFQKQNNSLYAFFKESSCINCDKFSNYSKNTETNSKQSKIRRQNSNSNLSSTQVIEDSQNQDIQNNLSKIFQIQIHKNFQEDDSVFFPKNQQENSSLKHQNPQITYQSPVISKRQLNIDQNHLNKLELQKYQQQNSNSNIFLDNQNQIYRKTLGINLQENSQSYQENTSQTDLGRKMKFKQINYLTNQIKSLQSPKILFDGREDAFQEQEGFTSYLNNSKIFKGQYLSSQKLTTSSFTNFTNEKFEKTISFKSQISNNKNLEIESYTDLNKNEKPISFSQKIEQIIAFNLDKKLKCKCPQIMLVDDNQFNLYALSKIIQQFQFDLITFSDGDQAIQFIKSQFFSNCCRSPQLILMDIEMPVKNGYETVKEIIQFYKNLQYNNIPIIVACTAYVGQEDYQKSIESGMSDFINKPILKVAFQNLIINYINAICNKY